MPTITTLAELVDHAVAVANGEASWESVEILPGAAAIPIRVAGAGWGKYIDSRGAHYVSSMQEKLNELFRSYPGQLPATAPLVKVEVRQGSNELLPYLEPIVRMVVDKVSADQVVEIIKYGIFCITGCWGLGRVASLIDSMDKRRNDRKGNEKIIENITSQQRQALEAIEKSVETIRQVVVDNPEDEVKSTAPIRNYVNSLDANDTIAIASVPPIPVKEAKEIFKRRRRSRTRMQHAVCDSNFKICGLNFDQPTPRLELEQNEKKYLALIERLTDEERNILLTNVDQRLKTEGAIYMDLRVTVYFTNLGINRICVVGLGKPRSVPHIYALEDVPQSVADAYDEFNRPPDE